MLGQVSKDGALNDLHHLTGEEPISAAGLCHTIANRLAGSEGLDGAMDYVSEELVSLGYSVEYQDWTHAGYSNRNRIARQLGLCSPTEDVHFVARVDGVKMGGEERSPVADDDVRGIVDDLGLARILSSRPFSRTVVLLFTTGEEQGTLGSRSHLGQLSAPGLASIKYVVDVDMVGYDGDDDGTMELWQGGHSPSLALTQRVSEAIRTCQPDLALRFVVGCG